MLDLLERPLRNGSIIHMRYHITSFIGKGSYGMVYLASDVKTKKTVIVKQLRQRKRRNREVLLKKEARMLEMFNHQAIPKCLDFFNEVDQYFLIMEYMEGKNFEDLVLYERKRYPEIASLRILLKVLMIVKYVHSHGVIHRDLRLPNILLKDEEISIIDFGLACFWNEKKEKPSSKIPIEKQLFREVSVKSDFYALGHFLLFLLYSDYEATTRKERSWEEELDISNGTRKIIRKMLQLDESYEHVDELIQDVENILKINI